MKKLFKNKKKMSMKSVALLSSCVSLGMLAVSEVFASDLKGIASNITDNFTSVTNLITASSYLGGLCFAIGSILKFKAHKDNPTQIPIGTPIGLMLVAAALLFLPSILGVTGSTIFGSSGGVTAGPTGTIFGS